MASLEKISFTKSKINVIDGCLVRTPALRDQFVDDLPQIVWADNTPWREANLWALSQREKGIDPKTILSSLTHLHAYAKWLEAEDVRWWHFPARESERCLTQYRGYLICVRDKGELAPSTTTQRMGATIRFYRWLEASKLLSTDWPMWAEKQVGIKLLDQFGFARTIVVNSTNLSIPNRKAPSDKLEDGLTPLSRDSSHRIINFASQNASYELYLMLKLGFGTGMRVGTICDLRMATIHRAIPDPQFLGFYRLAVGPGAYPTVHTKFGVTGQIWISESNLNILKEYIFSTRRLIRQSKARSEDRDAIFLTRDGKLFGEGDGNASRGISVQLSRLKKRGIANGISDFYYFKFHQTRCTYATELARSILAHGSVSMAVQIVKQALLHKSEKTTLTYIRFVEKSAVMSKVADEFTREFLGIAGAESQNA